jgi:predicted enzyme related to lactoylglutathione lyase
MKLEMMLSWVNVADHAKAKQFYGDVLGLKPVFEMEGWAEFSHAEGAVSVGLNAMRAAKGKPVKPGATIVFKVDDLDKACADLRKRGVKFEGEIHEVPGVVRIATFSDPFGNPLQLAQPLVG